MRVFDSRTWCIKTVRFQDCRAYLERCFSRVGVTAQHMAMYANFLSDRAVARLQKSFAPLMTYVHGSDGLYTMSSLREAQVHVDATHEEAVWSLVEAIPRSVPITDVGLMLDQVDWYSAPCATAVYRPAADATLASFYGYYSNHVAVKRQGAKHVIVELMIERFVSGDALKPCPDAFRAFSDLLGKPQQSERMCVFEDHEETMWRNAARALREEAAMLSYDAWFEDCENERTLTVYEQIGRLPNALKPMSGFSPKTVLQSEAKRRDFHFLSYHQGSYTFYTTTVYGQRLEFVITIPPMTSYVFMKVFAHGWNVHVLLGGTPQATVSTAEDLAVYAEHAFAAAEDMTVRYTDRLYRTFGETPRWYWETL